MENTEDPKPTEEAAKPVAGEPEKSEGTVTKETGEANTEKTAPSSGESFSQIDPNSLSPENREAYDNMLRDYKKKTAEIADQRREYDSLSEKAKMYDQVSSDEDFVRFWNGNAAKSPVDSGAPAPPPVDPAIEEQEFTSAFESKDNFRAYMQKLFKEKTEESEKRIKQTEGELRLQKANNFIKEFQSQPGHEDFRELDKSGIITGYIRLNPPKSFNEQEWDKKLNEALDYARKLKTQWFEQGRSAAIGRAQEKTKSSTEEPSSSPAQVYNGGDPTKITTKQAIDMARRGIKVPRS